MTAEFKDNTDKGRFEYHTDGAIVFANYHRKDGTLYIDYVEAPEQLRGSGAAGKLMAQIMETVKQDQVKVIPVCGYAALWLQRHPEHKELLG
jgi:predicted GNAT family acetyltransferase